MRVFSRKVAELGAEVDDLDEAKSVLNSLSLATGSINRLVRTHTHIPALELDPSAMLREALLELQLEWPELRKFGHQFRTPEEIEKIEEEAAAYMAAHPELNQDQFRLALRITAIHEFPCYFPSPFRRGDIGVRYFERSYRRLPRPAKIRRSRNDGSRFSTLGSRLFPV